MPGPSLKIKSVIGFNGKVTNGLHYTPCGGYIVYPLGSFVVLKNLKTDKESFLEGHTREISCLTISSDGSLVASGQTSLMGVKADVIVWDLVSAIRKLDAGEVMQGDAVLIHRLRQHLGHVRCVDFSYKGDFLATMGGQDDNAILVWSMRTGNAVCGGSAGSDSGYVVKWLNNRNDRFVSAGNFHVRVWQIDFSLPKLHAVDVKLGSARRLIQSVAIDNTDTYAYCGTSTGDILKIAIDRDEIRGFNDPDTKIPQMVGIGKDRYAGGLRAMVCVTNPSTGNSNLLIGAGDGTILYVNPSLKTVHGLKTVLMGGITSLSLHPSGQRILAGTAQCNRYDVSIDLAEADMKASCHFGAVNDVTFPEGCPDLVVTSSSGDVRIWKDRKSVV
jgi:WD40 repeat protein